MTEENPAGGARKYLHLRHLERYELRTPYPEIASKVATLVRSPTLMPTEYDPSRCATPAACPSWSWTIPGWDGL